MKNKIRQSRFAVSGRAPAVVHREGVRFMNTLIAVVIILFIVFIFLLTYSTCVVAKDEDDAVQEEWIRDYLEKRQTGEPGKEEMDRT